MELWKMVDIKVEGNEIELEALERTFEEYRSALAWAEISGNYDILEQFEDIDFDTIKQLLQSSPIDERIRISVSVQYGDTKKAFYSICKALFNIKQKQQKTNEDIKEEIELKRKMLEFLSKFNANEQYYLMYHVMFNIYKKELNIDKPNTSIANIRRKRQIQKKKLKEIIKKLYYDEGLTQKEIAKKLEISERTVRRYLNEYADI